ncbi:MAG: Rid family detoxifying hydrolase [Aigarchaeota archaeon]|nr:Rid family detoxifying hydrolase [Aigarchaeota archaeon]MCX8193251.1 Rid family detoxifying hydrolase [Nitrososphaeria archaeon]MDW7986890.1 Rid family detoxifying hydrolase [Nitrososphaerota archaeon]
MVGEIIYTEKAPKPVAPYSQAIRCGKFLFISGQLGIDPNTGKLVEGGFEEQARKIFQNIGAILEAAGYKFNDVVKVNIYLKSSEYFKILNRVYEEFFTETKPTRTTIIAPPPIDEALIEIDLIAYRDD